MNVSAQEIDSLQCNSVEARIDSLATQLSKLQKDYDYLYCNHQLTCLKHELKILLNDIQISSNNVQIGAYHRTFNADYYVELRKTYDTYIESLNINRDMVESKKAKVKLKISTSNFSSDEEFLLLSYLDYLDVCVLQIEQALVVHNIVLNTYKESR